MSDQENTEEKRPIVRLGGNVMTPTGVPLKAVTIEFDGSVIIFSNADQQKAHDQAVAYARTLGVPQFILHAEPGHIGMRGQPMGEGISHGKLQ